MANSSTSRRVRTPTIPLPLPADAPLTAEERPSSRTLKSSSFGPWVRRTVAVAG